MLDCDFSYQRQGFQLSAQFKQSVGVLGILGASGAGKSTLLNIVAGLLKPTAGYVRYEQQVLCDVAQGVFVPAHQRRIGLLFQDGQLFPHLNVKHNLLYGYQRIAEAQRRFEYAHIIALLEIEHLTQRPIQQLSGGEAQRVALGRALLYSPQLLLLDEPLSALDARLKQQILPFFAKVRDEVNIPMLYVTHQPAELTYLQADLLYINQGVIRPSTG